MEESRRGGRAVGLRRRLHGAYGWLGCKGLQLNSGVNMVFSHIEGFYKKGYGDGLEGRWEGVVVYQGKRLWFGWA